jgi:hypothetical protein
MLQNHFLIEILFPFGFLFALPVLVHQKLAKIVVNKRHTAYHRIIIDQRQTLGQNKRYVLPTLPQLGDHFRHKLVAEPSCIFSAETF